MREDLEDQFFERFPKLFPNGKDVDPKISLMYYGFGCRDGWFKLIWELCEDIEEIIEDEGPEDFFVVQVKQKFGGLRFYTSEPNNKIYELITIAENDSVSICEDCGEFGTLRRGQGLLRTACDSCYEFKMGRRGKSYIERLRAEEKVN